MKVMVTGLAAALAVCVLARMGAAAGGQGKGDEKKAEDKPMLYTDDEAKKLVKPAEAVVPVGETRPKKKVFEKLKIDPKRLRDRRVVQTKNVYFETWQLSEGFDLTWKAAIQDRTPLEKEDREIYGVRVQPRVQPAKK